MYYRLRFPPRRSSQFAALLFLALGSCNTPEPAPQATKETVIQKDNEGFVQMFDGKTLNGWEGDSTFWRMEDGILVGELTASTPIKTNSFLIWRDGVTADFELKTDFRITPDGNSGINYRSEEMPGIPFALKGYQADIDGKNTYTGLNYEERGRTFLARRSEKVIIETSKKPELLEHISTDDSLLSKIKTGDWNEYYLIAKGNHLQHYINGVLMSDVTDNDTVNRKFSGLLGLQVHVGPPMKVEYRNLRIKQ
jgi:hypothetical protein